MFHQSKSFQKFRKMLLISTETLFWLLKYSNFCNFSHSCPTKFQEGIKNEIIITSWNCLHKLPTVIFEIISTMLWSRKSSYIYYRTNIVTLTSIQVHVTSNKFYILLIRCKLIFEIIQLNLFELKCQKWSGDGSPKKENFCTYLATRKRVFHNKSHKKRLGFNIKMKLYLYRIFDNVV